MIAALPVWAYSFAGTMQQPETEDEVLVEAAELYGSCSSCHGGTGGGGTGYQLSDGEVLETFPEPIDMMVHVARGSVEIAGQEYGAERSDGRRVSGARNSGPMPAQLASLTQIELELVVFHERAILSGEDTTTAGYEEWIEHMREGIESGNEDPIDLDLLLACANPEYTPGATGRGLRRPRPTPAPALPPRATAKRLPRADPKPAPFHHRGSQRTRAALRRPSSFAPGFAAGGSKTTGTEGAGCDRRP